MFHELADLSPAAPSGRFPKEDRPALGPAPQTIRQGGMDKPTVAQLSREAIAGMTNAELAEVVIAVKPCPNLEARVGFYDRPLLLRLAFLARYVCRRQGY